jgi:hypothetical protein
MLVVALTIINATALANRNVNVTAFLRLVPG